MILTNRFSFVVAAFFVRRQELLKHARLEEYHEIEDPEEVGLDVHQQLTELFYEKYLGTQTHKERQRSQWKIKQKSTMMTRKKETIMRRRTKKRSRKGCHMNVCTCQFAALGGHLEMLRQRLSLGCIIIAFNLNTSLLKSVHHLVSTLSLFFFFSLLLQSSSSKTHFSPACTRKNSGSWSTREREREREEREETGGTAP